MIVCETCMECVAAPAEDRSVNGLRVALENQGWTTRVLPFETHGLLLPAQVDYCPIHAPGELALS